MQLFSINQRILTANLPILHCIHRCNWLFHLRKHYFDICSREDIHRCWFHKLNLRIQGGNHIQTFLMDSCIYRCSYTQIHNKVYNLYHPNLSNLRPKISFSLEIWFHSTKMAKRKAARFQRSVLLQCIL